MKSWRISREDNDVGRRTWEDKSCLTYVCGRYLICPLLSHISQWVSAAWSNNCRAEAGFATWDLILSTFVKKTFYQEELHSSQPQSNNGTSWLLAFAHRYVYVPAVMKKFMFLKLWWFWINISSASSAINFDAKPVTLFSQTWKDWKHCEVEFHFEFQLCSADSAHSEWVNTTKHHYFCLHNSLLSSSDHSQTSSSVNRLFLLKCYSKTVFKGPNQTYSPIHYNDNKLLLAPLCKMSETSLSALAFDTEEIISTTWQSEDSVISQMSLLALLFVVSEELVMRYNVAPECNTTQVLAVNGMVFETGTKYWQDCTQWHITLYLYCRESVHWNHRIMYFQPENSLPPHFPPWPASPTVCSTFGVKGPLEMF